jgi:pimeloyl-ACP methyl ester carboxylesterase
VTYQFTEKQVYVNEHSICYLEGGIASSAAPILFLHGWAVGTAPYQEFLNTLCQRYKIIAPVLPGFGKSSRSNLNWDYNEYANFILDFLNTFTLEKVHIIGHSLGGGIAATIAVLRPSIVQSIVLLDSTGVPVEPVPKVFLKRVIEMTAQAPQIKFPQIIQIFKGFSYNFLFRTQNTIQVLLLSLKKDLKPLLPKIQSPCLLVWGANDLTTPLSAAQEFAQSITGSKLVVVNGVYHEWSIFFVEKVTSIIFEFIEEIEAGK